MDTIAAAAGLLFLMFAILIAVDLLALLLCLCFDLGKGIWSWLLNKYRISGRIN
jgi:hypothetical protein